MNAGTLQLGISNAIGSSSAVAINNSTLNLNGFSDSVGVLTFNNGTLSFGSGSPNTNTFVVSNIGNTSSGILTINGYTSGSTTFGALTAGIASGLLSEVYFTGYGSGALESSLAGGTKATGNGEPNAYLITPANNFNVWTGSYSATSSNWGATNGVTNNWSAGVPVSGNTLMLEFAGTGGASYLTPTMDNNYTANSLNFVSSAGAFDISQNGYTLTLAGNVPSIIQQSASNAVISGGTISVSTNSVVDVSGTGSLSISSAFTGSGGLTKLSAGTLILSGANSGYSGAIGVDAGILEASGNNSVLGTGSTTVLSGATFQINSGLTLANPISIAGTGAGGVGASIRLPVPVTRPPFQAPFLSAAMQPSIRRRVHLSSQAASRARATLSPSQAPAIPTSAAQSRPAPVR